MSDFWYTQPVPDEGVKPGEIDSSRTIAKKPQKLLDDFTWSTCTDEEAYAFLSEHYYDKDDTFKLDYTFESMCWVSGEHIVIRSDCDEIVGYSTYVPIKLRVEDKVLTFAQANFLCVHEGCRKLGFTPFLVQETVRRANMKGIWQGIATYKRDVRGSITKSHFLHRLLDVRNLIKVGFYNTNRPREKYYEIRGPCKRPWRKMESGDISKVVRILNSYTRGFKIAPHIDDNYARNWLLPIHSYVNDETDDFISFYDISYARTDETGVVKQAYRFFIVGDVYNDAFLIAKNLGFHVFNTLDVGEDVENLKRHKFIEGVGSLYYNLFNWNLRSAIESKEINIILP